MASPFVLACHDLFVIHTSGLTPGLRARFEANLGHFAVKNTVDHDPGSADVVVAPMASSPDIPAFSSHLNHIYGFTTAEYQGHTVVCLLRGRTPEFCIFFSPDLRVHLHFCPKYAREGRIYGMVLFAIYLMMKSRDRLLVHGAAVSKQGKTVVFSGHQGMGKTPILLSLLREGWQCLGDDKLFLCRNRLSMVEPYAAISQYHFDLLPWLSSFLPHRLTPVFPGIARGFLDRAAGRIWPAGLPVKVYRYLNPGTKVDLRVPPFSNTLIQSGTPVHWIIIQRDTAFAFKPLSRDRGLDKLALVQDLFFSHRVQMEKLICLYGDTRLPAIRDILDRNLPETSFSQVSYSGEKDIGPLLDLVETHVG